MAALRGELILPVSKTELAPPDHLSPHAAEHWQDLVEVLGPTGLLTEVDAASLALLCENMAEYWNLRTEARKINWDDEAKQSDTPLTKLKRRLAFLKELAGLEDRVKVWLEELLLTPAARMRAQPLRPPAEERELDLSVLDADERAALRAMLEKHRGDPQRMLQ